MTSTTTKAHRHPATTDWSKILRDTLQANVAAATDTQLIDSLAKLVARDADTEEVRMVEAYLIDELATRYPAINTRLDRWEEELDETPMAVVALAAARYATR